MAQSCKSSLQLEKYSKYIPFFENPKSLHYAFLVGLQKDAHFPLRSLSLSSLGLGFWDNWMEKSLQDSLGTSLLGQTPPPVAQATRPAWPQLPTSS